MVSPSQQAFSHKYVIKAKFEVEGVVEKPDVIGAIFGQTEGLFGSDLDLRELQKSGRIGRIEITLKSEKDKTTGTIIIPSSLDKVSTAIIAAALESVDRIGPCESKIILDKVEDVREEKRKAIMEKAKEILKKWIIETTPSTEEILKEVSEAVRQAEVIEYGPEKLPAGPEVDSGSLIIVEGRADVINLLKCGIKNVIGVEGTKIPQTVIELARNKETTAFLDGDRGGDLILKELLQVADIDYVARAPPGKEVEELTPKEIMKALRDRVPVERIKEVESAAPAPRIAMVELPEKVLGAIRELRGTLEALLYDESWNELERIPVSELAERLKASEGVRAIVFDGVVTQRLLDLAEEKGVKTLIGDRVSDLAKRPLEVKVMTMSDVAR
ncbi:MAG: DNA primase DnaG [Candidatus Bathyarchaeia archaeon]